MRFLGARPRTPLPPVIRRRVRSRSRHTAGPGRRRTQVECGWCATESTGSGRTSIGSYRNGSTNSGSTRAGSTRTNSSRHGGSPVRPQGTNPPPGFGAAPDVQPGARSRPHRYPRALRPVTAHQTGAADCSARYEPPAGPERASAPSATLEFGAGHTPYRRELRHREFQVRGIPRLVDSADAPTDSRRGRWVLPSCAIGH